MQLKKMVLTSMIATIGIMGTSIVANATITHPAGGTWNYGLVDHNPYYMAYSYYYQPKRYHRSSVRLGDNVIYRSNKVAPGYTSEINSPTKYKQRDAEYWYYNF